MASRKRGFSVSSTTSSSSSSRRARVGEIPCGFELLGMLKSQGQGGAVGRVTKNHETYVVKSELVQNDRSYIETSLLREIFFAQACLIYQDEKQQPEQQKARFFPHILPLRDVFFNCECDQDPAGLNPQDIRLRLVMQEAKQGDLKAFTQSNLLIRGRVGKHQYKPNAQTQVLEVLRDAACAISEIHSVNIIHGDIKPHNFLVQDILVVNTITGEQRRKPWIYLTDFGGCGVRWNFPPEAITPDYADPELLKEEDKEDGGGGGHWGLPNDMYSYGKMIQWFLSAPELADLAADKYLPIAQVDRIKNNLIRDNWNQAKFVSQGQKCGFIQEDIQHLWIIYQNSCLTDISQRFTATRVLEIFATYLDGWCPLPSDEIQTIQLATTLNLETACVDKFARVVSRQAPKWSALNFREFSRLLESRAATFLHVEDVPKVCFLANMIFASVLCEMGLTLSDDQFLPLVVACLQLAAQISVNVKEPFEDKMLAESNTQMNLINCRRWQMLIVSNFHFNDVPTYIVLNWTETWDKHRNSASAAQYLIKCSRGLSGRPVYTAL
jgi:serine/threonine protein kinase